MLFKDSEPSFEKVCQLTDLMENKGQKFTVGDIDIAVFKVHEQVFAVQNVCTHLHKSVLCDGFVENGFVACPAHGWEFNLSDGKRPGGGRGIESYPVEIRDGEVFVKVSQKKFRY